MSYTTYAIYDPRTKWPVYIGQTGNYDRRRDDHMTTFRERKASPPGSLQHWLKALHKAGLEPQFLQLEVVETESESLKSETKWIAKFSGMGLPLLNRWDEHKPFIVEATEKLEAFVFRADVGREGKPGKFQRSRAAKVGTAEPNKNRTGWRVHISKTVIEGPVTIDLVPPKAK